MTEFHFAIFDHNQRMLAEDDIEEDDSLSACRTVAVALAIFTFSGPGGSPSSVVLTDSEGERIARISLTVDKSKE